MMNYARGFNQSEAFKYFEWTIIKFIARSGYCPRTNVPAYFIPSNWRLLIIYLVCDAAHSDAIKDKQRE